MNCFALRRGAVAGRERQRDAAVRRRAAQAVHEQDSRQGCKPSSESWCGGFAAATAIQTQSSWSPEWCFEVTSLVCLGLSWSRLLTARRQEAHECVASLPLSLPTTATGKESELAPLAASAPAAPSRPPRGSRAARLALRLLPRPTSGDAERVSKKLNSRHQNPQRLCRRVVRAGHQ